MRLFTLIAWAGASVSFFGTFCDASISKNVLDDRVLRLILGNTAGPLALDCVRLLGTHPLKTASATPRFLEALKSLPLETKDKLRHLASLYNRLGRDFSDKPALAIREIYKDKRILPMGGIVHVLSPGFDAYQWIVPLLARPDARIYVSDALPWVGRQIHASGERRMLWQHAWAYNSFLLQNKIKSFEQFEEEIERRVFYLDHEGRSSVPQADVVFARHSVGSGAGTPLDKLIAAAKPNGLLWRVGPSYQTMGHPTLELFGAIGCFAPSPYIGNIAQMFSRGFKSIAGRFLGSSGPEGEVAFWTLRLP